MTAPSAHPIAIVSPLGGSGRTTLTAHLATLVATQGRPCLAIDLCRQNMLGRHLGAQESNPTGWATLAAQDLWCGDAALSNSDAVDWLPFGTVNMPELSALQHTWALNPDWLQNRLQALALPADSAIFLDTPTWPAPLSFQALAAARVVLVVLEASARACHAQALVKQALAQAPAGAVCAIAVNRIDPRRPSHRSALETLRAQWGDLLLPYPVHEDESIAQAYEQAANVCAWAPHAQSSHDLQGIGQWLLKHLPAPRPATAPALAQPA